MNNLLKEYPMDGPKYSEPKKEVRITGGPTTKGFEPYRLEIQEVSYPKENSENIFF